MPNAQGKPTLGDLIDEIADDIERADLDRQIEIAISRAIRHYQPERFFFSERILTFETLAGTDVYFGGDAPDIPEPGDRWQGRARLPAGPRRRQFRR
ncbi:hypothetical protein [Methylobacterium sp. WCS2018Hpa-22]|uniref:hypothetical protein n=1 Tax=Methylobacterium sp. WCS2018Hpa-22 TaxID=3073633 RepID=UPI00288ABE01|nr:hypothetical protein [Methylobacterium sp. WCS2018Hpa-22]